jgi:uncharacterized YigZ family protein
MLFDDNYKTIISKSEGFYKERGSKFISFAIPVTSEAEVKEFLEKKRKEYHDARHVCFAYILGFDKSGIRMNDDGEPSGTAGRPIYGQLLSFDLTNTLVAVVRYFGGTKLGVSGLINAYKTAAQDALNNAEIITLKITDVYEIIYPYSMMNDVMKIIKEENLEQVSSSFELECKVSFLVEKNNSNKVYEKFQRFENLKINYLKTI